MLRPVSTSVAPLHLVRPARPASDTGRDLGGEAPGTYGPGRPRGAANDGARGDVAVTVRVFAHGGSAVIARSQSGGIDAMVR